MNRAVFFDKDGVLNVDNGVYGTSRELDLYSCAADVIAACRSKEYRVIVVTNQPIVARGIITESRLVVLLEEFRQSVLEQNRDAIIDKIYYCPHHPNADRKEYRKFCNCRKPKPGMLLQAEEEFDLDLGGSYMVGDRISDIIAGYLAGCTTILCNTGRQNDKPIETDLVAPCSVKADYSVVSVCEVDEIVS